MTCSQNKIQTVSLELGDGWSGKVVLLDLSDEARKAKADASGMQFSKADWLNCLSHPSLLFENVEKILKTQGRNCVAVKTLVIGNTQLKVVVKRHFPQDSLRQFFRSFRQGRALRNLETSLKLQRLGVPVVAPLAALQQKKGPLTRQSIYITRYLENGCNLHTFCRQQLSKEFQLRKHLSSQLASILASLHKNGLWHRDSKATNFIVCKGAKDEHKVLLTDVDGIKPYFRRRRSQRLRSLWQLAASLLTISSVNRTDFLRTFISYCNLTGIESSHRRKIFRQLSDKAKAKHLLRMAAKNILIIKPSSLGDIVMALPALSVLRRSFPEAKISWLVRPEFAPLLKNHPDLNEVILFDRKFLGKALFNPHAMAALLSLIRQLRRGRFDAVIDLQGLFRTACFAWLSGCKRRFGMANAREFGHIFYTHKVEQDSDCIHLVDYYLKIVQTAGAFQTPVRFSLPFDAAAANAVTGLLRANDINGSFACFVPASAHADKCWPIERFAALADRVSAQFDLSIIATGSDSERDVVEELRNLASVPVTNFAGDTSISELVTLLNNAKVVVSNDTGPGHIAAALGVPVVLIFGPTNPARVHPYNRPECAVGVEPDGRGFKADSADPKHDIRFITVDEVYEKVCEQLNRH